MEERNLSSQPSPASDSSDGSSTKRKIPDKFLKALNTIHVCEECRKEIRGSGPYSRHMRAHIDEKTQIDPPPPIVEILEPVKKADKAEQVEQNLGKAKSMASNSFSASAQKAVAIAPEQLEQLRSISIEQGGGAFWVSCQKVDQGRTVARRQDYLTLEELENRAEWCRDWAGPGRYQIHVYARNDRTKALDVLIVDVDEIYSKPQSVPGKGSIDPAMLELQKELLRLRAEAERGKIENDRKREEDSLRADVKRLEAVIADLKSAPKELPLGQIATAIAPVLSELTKARQASDERMIALITAMMQRDNNGPIIAAIEKSQSAERAEMMKMISEQSKQDKYEGMAKLMSASASMTQAMVATMGTVVEKISALAPAEEPAWKEPLAKLVDMASTIVGAQAEALTAKPQQPQLSGQTVVHHKEAIEEPESKLKKIRAEIMKYLDRGSQWNAQAGKWGVDPVEMGFRLFEYAEIVSKEDPSDKDVSFFLDNHSDGARRLVGAYLSTRGLDGARYMDDIIAALPGAYNEFMTASEESSTTPVTAVA